MGTRPNRSRGVTGTTHRGLADGIRVLSADRREKVAACDRTSLSSRDDDAPGVHETPRRSGNGRLLAWRTRSASRMALSHETPCAHPTAHDAAQELQPGPLALAFFVVVGAVSLWAALVILP